MHPTLVKILRVSLLFFSIIVAGSASCPESMAKPKKPVRIAYIEGGFYTDYASILVATTQGLAELGLIKNGSAPLPPNTDTTAKIWQWLSANAGGNTIEFVSDAYYSAGWDEDLFAKKRAELLTRLTKTKDIDLVLAFGTKAGQAMAADDHKTPVAVLSVTDAVTAGIIPSSKDSGRDHVFAMVEDNLYYEELTLFHDLFKFKRLGIAYEDSEKGRASIALPQIQKAAETLGFDLLTCVNTLYTENTALAVTNLIECHEKLVEADVDAVYLTLNSGMQPDSMGAIIRPLMEKRLPTFSQNGVEDVRRGVLLSISQEDFSGQGRFAAKALANIIKGESPRSQKQIYEEPINLALNLRTAMLIGWNPSLAALSAIDEIFQGQ